MIRIFFATSNQHKVDEANRIGKDFGVEFERLDADYPELRDESIGRIAEDGAGFVFNEIGKPVIVEDSGLFISSLNGFPGPYSAYVYKKIGNQGILRLLEGMDDRAARFVSAIGYHDGERVRVFEGQVEGRISDSETGLEGFGYDPIFIPDGHDKTFAKDPTYKATVSHRVGSVTSFCRFLNLAGGNRD